MSHNSDDQNEEDKLRRNSQATVHHRYSQVARVADNADSFCL